MSQAFDMVFFTVL